ncbi:MAG: hypothetical protein AABY22_33440 [Nanoarchaeota archaeon]
MSDPAKLAVALQAKDLGMTDIELEKSGLVILLSDYEDPEVCIHKIKKVKDMYNEPDGRIINKNKQEEEDNEDEDQLNPDTYFGILVSSTWNGVINIDSLDENVDAARDLFRQITKKKGKLILVGNQE